MTYWLQSIAYTVTGAALAYIGSVLFPSKTIGAVQYVDMSETLTKLCRAAHDNYRKWWQDPATGGPISRETGALLMLVVSELAEAMEGDRKSLMDDHLPQYRMYHVELIDALIRIHDLLGHEMEVDGTFNPDEVYWAKTAYNMQRADHKPENRLLPGGKRY